MGLEEGMVVGKRKTVMGAGFGGIVKKGADRSVYCTCPCLM